MLAGHFTTALIAKQKFPKGGLYGPNFELFRKLISNFAK